LHRGRHDFGFSLARLVGRDECPEPVNDDVHGVAHFGELFVALDRACHIELAIKGNQRKRTPCQLHIVAYGHDEIHAVHSDSFPSTFLPSFAKPASWNIRPDMVFDPGLGLVADPTRLPRKYKRRLARQRQY